MIATAHGGVLLIDDDADIHPLVAGMLRALDVSVRSAFTAGSGLAEARRQRPSLILLDHDLPDGSGLDLLTRTRSDAVLSDVPIIMITGTEQREVLTACFGQGASDYLRKPFIGAELRARVQTVLDRQRLLAELSRAAHIDTLTGLPNRALLMGRLAHAMERRDFDPTYHFALLFIDFDRFKLINDSLGHDVGDQFLQTIGRRLRENLRVQDTIARDTDGTTVARLGGDEFVVVLDDVATPAAAAQVAERLRRVLEVPYLLGPHLVRSSASVGLVHSNNAYITPDEMLRDADIAMYEAKARGRNCAVCFTGDMRDAVLSRLRIENALRDAVGTDQFHLVYQPIVSLESGRTSSAEVLLRWNHPELGLVPPSTFIPIAEETRLILPISDDVLRGACLQFMHWKHTIPDTAPAFMSVNLSRVQLADEGVAGRILAILEETGIPPECLQLEVTESQLMQQQAMATALLNTLRSHGIRLAMDDFGTGYSSLSCLQEYPFDVLKIDRALTENVSRGRGYAALLHAVTTLAENLGLDVVAEGIETVEQLALLQALGCGYGQGYLLARPLDASALEQWLRTPYALPDGVMA